MTPPRAGIDRRRPSSALLLLLSRPRARCVAAALTPTASLFPDQGDVGLYLEKARAFARGSVPYRDFPFEYPPARARPDGRPRTSSGGSSATSTSTPTSGCSPAGRRSWCGARACCSAGSRDSAVRASRAAIRPGWRCACVVLTIGAALALTWRFDLFPACSPPAPSGRRSSDRPGAAGVALGLGRPREAVPGGARPGARGALARAARRAAASSGSGCRSRRRSSSCMVPFVVFAGRDAFAFAGYQAPSAASRSSRSAAGSSCWRASSTGQPADMSFDFSAVKVRARSPHDPGRRCRVLTVARLRAPGVARLAPATSGGQPAMGRAGGRRS